MLDHICYHGNTAGHVPMLFLMRLTFVNDERTAELINTADFGQTTAEFSIWATWWPTATPPLLPRMQSEKKGVLSVALKALFPPWDGKRGEQLFLDYRAGKVFWCSTCSCFIKPRLKVLLPRTPYASEQPSLCHAVIYDHCATLIPRSALLHKTCFPPPTHFSFLPVFAARRKNCHHEMCNRRVFPSGAGWAGTRFEWKFLSNTRMSPRIYVCSFDFLWSLASVT